MKLIFPLLLKEQSISCLLLALFYVDSAFAVAPTINNIFSNSSAIHVKLLVNELGLKNTTNQDVPAQFDVFSCWGEKVSVDDKNCENSRSIHVDSVRFQTQLNTLEKNIFRVNQSPKDRRYFPLDSSSKQNIILNTETAEFIINKRKFNLLDYVKYLKNLHGSPPGPSGIVFRQ